MSENMITILCALIGSGAATALVTASINRRAEARRKETGESQGMRWLLQDRLEHLAQAYLDRVPLKNCTEEQPFKGCSFFATLINSLHFFVRVL